MRPLPITDNPGGVRGQPGGPRPRMGRPAVVLGKCRGEPFEQAGQLPPLVRGEPGEQSPLVLQVYGDEFAGQLDALGGEGDEASARLCALSLPDIRRTGARSARSIKSFHSCRRSLLPQLLARFPGRL
jgi:hypothetical protein